MNQADGPDGSDSWRKKEKRKVTMRLRKKKFASPGKGGWSVSPSQSEGKTHEGCGYIEEAESWHFFLEESIAILGGQIKS